MSNSSKDAFHGKDLVIEAHSKDSAAQGSLEARRKGTFLKISRSRAEVTCLIRKLGLASKKPAKLSRKGRLTIGWTSSSKLSRRPLNRITYACKLPGTRSLEGAQYQLRYFVTLTAFTYILTRLVESGQPKLLKPTFMKVS